ncbi:MAG: tRNA (5-methylaminomethyl-2-thiouridine)(34)-methyltransferase MnmD [Tannerella sp.]|jgi:tRNA U34 5-methylaminomethyl-2-thiouridine-forming methyltransferase MnmC|nr:tRNA (5-methylaminomethyl-2-thiouridine)(34)-methyltransferase MnmD [Tannerella sp.]
MQTTIRTTEDGSHTLYVAEMDECYHSTHGAVQESMHVFIRDGLHAFMQQTSGGINVLEIGFGTGLNAFLTLCEAEKWKRPVRYTSLELYPLAADEAVLLNYPEILHADEQWFEKIHRSSWDTEELITPCFTLCKVKADFTRYELQGLYDVIYFDAFSPEKQPELWSEDGFRKIYAHSTHGAVLTTYCAKGAVRRALQSAGFVVERLAGPPGKREILRGAKKLLFQ